MTRYATKEEQWDCWVCGIICTLREMYIPTGYPQLRRCPNCRDSLLIYQNGRLERAMAFNNPTQLTSKKVEEYYD